MASRKTKVGVKGKVAEAKKDASNVLGKGLKIKPELIEFEINDQNVWGSGYHAKGGQVAKVPKDDKVMGKPLQIKEETDEVDFEFGGPGPGVQGTEIATGKVEKIATDSSFLGEALDIKEEVEYVDFDIGDPAAQGSFTKND